MPFILFAVVTMVRPSRAWAEDRLGYLKLSNGHELYVNYKEAEPGKPTVVLFNGLSQNTTTWDPVAADLVKAGFGVVRFDAMGQGNTLAKSGPYHDLSYENQVADVIGLLDALGIKEKVDLAGLSYGGGIAVALAAEHPERVRKVISLNGFIQAKDDAIVRETLDSMARVNPYFGFWKNTVYESTVKSFLYWKFLLKRYGPAVDPNLIEATYRLAVGIRDFDAFAAAASLPPNSLHLVVGQADDVVRAADSKRFWNHVPAEARGSLLEIKDGPHTLSEGLPHFIAAWITRILGSDPGISDGDTFYGTPATGEVSATAANGEVRSDRPVFLLPVDATFDCRTGYLHLAL